jgi:hypothetical protein
MVITASDVKQCGVNMPPSLWLLMLSPTAVTLTEQTRRL